MAPARMVSFIEEHATDCEICRQDPDLKEEIEKITELVLPESKIPKAVRQKNSQEDDVDPDEEDDVEDDEDNTEDDESDDDDEDDEPNLDEMI